MDAPSLRLALNRLRVSMHRPPFRPARLGCGLRRTARRWGRDDSGTSAIEFALVVLPFFALVMGIITIGVQYLTAHFLEHGVEAAARQIRTGEAQKAGLKLSDFRRLFCNAAGFMIVCDDRLVIHIKSNAEFAGLTPLTNCLTDGNLTPAEGNPDDAVRTRAGDASAAVVVSACYEWDMGLGFWQTIWNVISPMPVVQGKPILSAVAAFRSEPFE